MNIQQTPIDDLIPYARNPRKNDHAVDRVAAAIKEFGFRVPILAKSDGLVIDGHLRLKAARKLKMGTVPVLLADDMTDTQIKAFRLSVNRMAELAEWDHDLLKLELEDLASLDFDLDLIGFDDPDADLVSEDDAIDDMPAMPEGDRDPDSLGTITIRLLVHECEEIKEWLNTFKKGDPSGALLEACRANR